MGILFQQNTVGKTPPWGESFQDGAQKAPCPEDFKMLRAGSDGRDSECFCLVMGWFEHLRFQNQRPGDGQGPKSPGQSLSGP